jgi:hypothetical protein
MKLFIVRPASCALVAAALFTLAITPLSASAAGVAITASTQPPPCPSPLDHWVHHLNDWPVQGILLGGKAYSKTELVALLKMKPKGDMSMALAQQLAITKLNRAAGCPIAFIKSTMVHADHLLIHRGKLPYNLYLPNRTAIAMTLDAASLELYNYAKLTPDCRKGH